MKRTIPVSISFWDQLHKFVKQNNLSTQDLVRAGIAYGTANRISKGIMDSASCKEDHLKVIQKILKDPDDFVQKKLVISSLDDLTDLEIGSSEVSQNFDYEK